MEKQKNLKKMRDKVLEKAEEESELKVEEHKDKSEKTNMLKTVSNMSSRPDHHKKKD